MLRKIVKIDEEKCDGCGQCVPACAEGAIQVVGGKARLVSELYCDGLGACLGECPQDAITIEEREAEVFDEAAVARHLGHCAGTPSAHSAPVVHACPGSASQVLRRSTPAPAAETEPSALGNWPVQLSLVPVRAPYFEGARLLIAADCVPFALADFHRSALAGRALVVGCPKLDNTDMYRRKLAEIFRQNDIQSVEVIYMEVPCCFGLVHLVRLALEESEKTIPLTLTKVSVRGAVLERSEPEKACVYEEGAS